MRVEVWLKETSQPIAHEHVINAYEKGDFYCVYAGEMVYKYPIIHIFRIIESYAG